MSATWRRYVAKVVMGASDPNGYIGLTTASAISSTSGFLSFCAVKVESGDVATAYSESTYGPAGTFGIAVGAVTVTATGVLSADTSFGAPPLDPVCSVTIAPESKHTTVIASVTVAIASGAGQQSIAATIYKNGSSVKVFSLYFPFNGATQQTWELSYIDATPGAGSHTYKLVLGTYPALTAKGTLTSIRAITLKR